VARFRARPAREGLDASAQEGLDGPARSEPAHCHHHLVGVVERHVHLDERSRTPRRVAAGSEGRREIRVGKSTPGRVESRSARHPSTEPAGSGDRLSMLTVGEHPRVRPRHDANRGLGAHDLPNSRTSPLDGVERIGR
jgi:hypothetical protein